jgi:hypothetical protein
MLYWLVIATFVILGPWGKIDTRNFSYMGQLKFWEYNFYIGFVLLSMLILSWVLWKGRAGLKALAWIVAVDTMFIVMCVFDMLHFFPDPAQPMPFWVWVIEIANSLIAFGIILMAQKLIEEF